MRSGGRVCRRRQRWVPPAAGSGVSPADHQGGAARGVPVAGVGGDEVLAGVVVGVGGVEHQAEGLAEVVGAGRGVAHVPAAGYPGPAGEDDDGVHPGAPDVLVGEGGVVPGDGGLAPVGGGGEDLDPGGGGGGAAGVAELVQGQGGADDALAGRDRGEGEGDVVTGETRPVGDVGLVLDVEVAPEPSVQVGPLVPTGW